MRAIIIDNGSYTTKVGVAGEDSPRIVFPTVVGYPKYRYILSDFELSKHMSYWGLKEEYIGEEAYSMKDKVEGGPVKGLKIYFPIKNGLIENWDYMEKIWQHTFYNELNLDPSEHPILLTEPPLNPSSNRERIAEIMFETFNVPALYILATPILSLLASGRSGGCVVEIRDDMINIVPIIGGLILSHSIEKIELGDLETIALRDQLLNEKQHELNEEILGDICDKLLKSIILSGTDERSGLYPNIVLNLGISSNPEFKEKIYNYLIEKVPSSVNFRISTFIEEVYPSWFGGSIIASLTSFNNYWITQSEYKDKGIRIINRCGGMLNPRSEGLHPLPETFASDTGLIEDLNNYFIKKGKKFKEVRIPNKRIHWD